MTTMPDPLAHVTLPASGITEHFSDEARAALAGYGEFITVEANQNLIDEGSDLNRLYILASGELSVRRQGQHQEAELARLKPGDTFGEISVFDPGPTSASVRPTQATSISYGRTGNGRCCAVTACSALARRSCTTCSTSAAAAAGISYILRRTAIISL